MAQIYNSWHKWVEPVLYKNPSIWKNFYSYYCYTNDFPSAGNPKAAYMQFVADYFLIRSYLCLYAISRQGLSKADVIDLFYSYYSRKQHDDAVETAIKNEFEESGLTEDVAIYSLLKIPEFE